MTDVQLSKQERVDVTRTAYEVPIRCLRDSRNFTLRDRKPTAHDRMGFAIWDEIVKLLIREREAAIAKIEAAN